jgi:protein-disulfide isomerase
VFVRQQAAAYAAGAQRRFWQYALLFLEKQGPAGTDYANGAFLDRLAREVPGLEFARWLRERKDRRLVRQVKHENEAALHKGLGSTPTLIVTGPRGMRRLEGVASFKRITAALSAVS